jgi:hypothetical protein
MNVNSLIKSAKIFIIDHGPEILTACGTIGLIVAGVMAVKETPTAMDILEEKREEKEKECGLPELNKKEKVQACWKVYTPSVLMATTSVACIIFARRIDSSRAAALATAYRMSEEALMRYENAAKEELGDVKAKKLEAKANVKEMQDKAESITADDILVTGNGNDLFYCPYNGRFFRSCINYLDKMLNGYVSDILDDDYQDLNAWITRLGFDPMEDVGDQLGINADMIRAERNSKLQIDYGPGPLGEPCGTVRLPVKPETDFWNPHG